MDCIYDNLNKLKYLITAVIFLSNYETQFDRNQIKELYDDINDKNIEFNTTEWQIYDEIINLMNMDIIDEEYIDNINNNYIDDEIDTLLNYNNYIDDEIDTLLNYNNTSI
jgi:hypothetical protein